MDYPNHDINPDDKNDKWLCNYAIQAWKEGATAQNIFYNAAYKYEQIKTYVLGEQDVSNQKAPYFDKAGKTFLRIDWRPRPIVSKFRDKAISRCQQRDFNIVATPIDALAKDDADKFFADAKVKILMRDALKKSNPELIESPVLVKEPKEAENLEELEMQMAYGWKHNMAIEAEQGFQLVAYQNDFIEQRRQTIINLFDYGVGGYKEWIDSKGNVRLRAVNPTNIITSYCRFADFRDLTHVGEVIEVPIIELEDIFSKDELKIIVDNNNSTQSGYRPEKKQVRPDKSKVTVLDLELYSWDDLVFNQRIDGRGNLQFGRKPYGYQWTNGQRDDSKIAVNKDGKLTEEPSVITRNVQKIYKVKWIIGTDYVYDTGIAKNQKREKNKLAQTCFSFHLYAYNFHEMKAQGIMEKLIPTIDEYQATIYKVQIFKNRWIPYIIDIDLDALEGVALGKGGENMTPENILDMMFQLNVLVGRRKDQAGNPNYKAVDVRPTPMANEFSVLLADLSRLLQEMSDISGFNELTDGSTPNPKTLVPVANMANESTNNALFPITYAEKSLLERLAKGVIQRLQIAVKSGSVEGVIHALGTGTVKFIQVSPDISLYAYGIKIEDKPTDLQKQMLLEKLNLKDAQGLIDPEDYVMIMNIDNLKQAQELLAYRVKKRREADEQKAINLQRMNGQIQIDSARAAEEEKRKTQVEAHAQKMEEINLKGGWDLKVAEVKTEGTVKAAEGNAGAKIAAQGMKHHADERKEKIKQGIPVEEMDDTPQDAIDDPNQDPMLGQQVQQPEMVQ